jgi:hypothetical protein
MTIPDVNPRICTMHLVTWRILSRFSKHTLHFPSQLPTAPSFIAVSQALARCLIDLASIPLTLDILVYEFFCDKICLPGVKWHCFVYSSKTMIHWVTLIRLCRTKPVAPALPCADMVGVSSRRKVPRLCGWLPFIPLTVSWAITHLHTGGASSSRGGILVASIKHPEHNKIYSDNIRTLRGLHF